MYIRTRWHFVTCILLFLGGLSLGATVFAPCSFAADLPAATFCAKHPMIEPGVGVGELKLGMPVSEVSKILGTPPIPIRNYSEKTSPAGTNGSKWTKLNYYPVLDLSVVAQNSIVVEIRIGPGTPNTEGCHTKEGIGIGGRMSKKIAKAYGKPDAEMPTALNAKFVVYNDRGVNLVVNKQGALVRLALFAPGTFCALNEKLTAAGWSGPWSCRELTPPLR